MNDKEFENLFGILRNKYIDYAEPLFAFAFGEGLGVALQLTDSISEEQTKLLDMKNVELYQLHTKHS